MKQAEGGASSPQGQGHGALAHELRKELQQRRLGVVDFAVEEQPSAANQAPYSAAQLQSPGRLSRVAKADSERVAPER